MTVETRDENFNPYRPLDSPRKAPHPFDLVHCTDCDAVRMCASIVIAVDGEGYWLCSYCLEDIAIQLFRYPDEETAV